MLIFTISDYVMQAPLQFKCEEQGSQKYVECRRPSSSYEGLPAACWFSFLDKKEKRRTIIIHCYDQS